MNDTGAASILVLFLFNIIVYNIPLLYGTVGEILTEKSGSLNLGVEGTYWMSASTRVVVGLLCACLAGWSFAWWLDRGGWYRGVLFAAVMAVCSALAGRKK